MWWVVLMSPLRSSFRYTLKSLLIFTPVRSSLAITALSRDTLSPEWGIPLRGAAQRQRGLALLFKFCVLVSLLLVMAWSTSSSADERDIVAKQTEQWLMAKYDTNGDSIISVDEISQKREKMFSYMDDNGDGRVSIDEYALLDAKKRALIVRARFTKLDANADGILTDEEYIEYYGSFGAFDLDGNGKITSDEINSETSVPSTQVAASPEPKCFVWLCVRSSVH